MDLKKVVLSEMSQTGKDEPRGLTSTGNLNVVGCSVAQG